MIFPQNKKTAPNRNWANGQQPYQLLKSSKFRSQFQKETLDTMRARLTDYLSAHGVELRREASRLKGKCPMHDDKNPSFAVFGSNHEWCGCFPCGFKGDVFAASQWLGRSSNFPMAVRDVATTLGVYVPNSAERHFTLPNTAPQRPIRQPAPPFTLCDADQKKVHDARLAFSTAFDAGAEIIDQIAKSLGFDRETLRLASLGSSGLGLADNWLCYAYPQGLKWRNPVPTAKHRFRWIVGKALAPWRMEWVKPDTHTIYLTEGESDCMALLASGLEDDGSATCVASPGTSFSREWASLFVGKRVVICFDTDPPGRKATANIAGILKGYAAEILAWKGDSSHE